jgi:hypothetical protein
VDLEVVAEPRVFDGNSNTNQWAESKESAMVLEEYAVSLWLRWTDDLEVSEETQF